MKAIVENPLLDMRAYAASLFVEILNEITACKNEEELRRCIRLLEKRHKYDKPELSWYFKWGFGHNHFWVSDLNGVRLIFVEFLRNSTTYAYISQNLLTS